MAPGSCNPSTAYEPLHLHLRSMQPQHTYIRPLLSNQHATSSLHIALARYPPDLDGYCPGLTVEDLILLTLTNLVSRGGLAGRLARGML
jgi:hypothetical protein